MGLDSIMESMIEKASVLRIEKPGDYRTDDGILHCGVCNEPKECVIDVDDTHKITVGCMCKCAEEEYLLEQKQAKERERMMFIDSLRIQGIQDSAIHKCTFAKADKTKNILSCMRYVEAWDRMLANNIGLLFSGTPGTGKTFAAACIANALIDKCVHVLMTSFPKILNAGYDKVEIANNMKRFQLLIIDDLGVERNTAYAQEIVQFIVDERYKSQLPLIVTTNLSRNELNNPPNIECSRIYDRVMEMCTLIGFSGESKRKQNAKNKMDAIKEILLQ